MRNFKKNLALLLAGALLMTSLVACESDDSKNSDEEKQTESSQTSDNTNNPENELLTPEAFSAAVYSDEDMTVITSQSATMDGETYSAELTYTRDGNRANKTYEEEDHNYKECFDFENGLSYFQSDGGEWASSELDYYENWLDLVESEIISENVEFFFDNGNYVKKNNRYELTDAGTKAYYDSVKDDNAFTQFGENPVLESYFERKDGSNVFYLDLRSEDGQTVITMKITVTLGDTTVELPEVAEDVPSDVLSPEALWELIIGNESMSIVRIQHNYEDDESEILNKYVRDGNSIECDYYSDEYEYEPLFFIDLNEGLKYYDGGDGLVVEEAPYSDWQAFVESSVFYLPCNESVFYLPCQLLFENDSYIWISEGYYSLTSQTSKEIIEYLSEQDEEFSHFWGQSPEFDAYIEYWDGVYRLGFTISDESGETRMSYTYNFAHDIYESVELPEILSSVTV